MNTPKYLLIKNDLLNEINNGHFSPGDKFYSESELKKRYNVSAITVVKSLQELTNEGFLVRYQGKGTFVAKGKKNKTVKFSDIEIFSGDLIRTIVVSIDLHSDFKILKQLNLSEYDSYYKITRIRFVQDTPFFVHISYIPRQYIKNNVPNIQYYSSIYDKFKEDFNINLYNSESVETNEICFPTPLEISEYLQIKPLEPTLLQIKHSFLEDGSVAEYVVSYKHWKYFKTQINTTQGT
ncbi:MAG: GntR family transcriptional regulator [Clostridium sp.]